MFGCPLWLRSYDTGLCHLPQSSSASRFTAGAFVSGAPPMVMTASGAHCASADPPDEFRKHAADCMQMAKLSRDPESKAMWNRMAERWRHCAERYVAQSLAARDRSPNRHRRSPPGWAHS
jgi:hypothetical protein